MRTTVWPAARWWRMNAITSALVTRAGVLSTTKKNTFKSNATASRVLGRARAVRNRRYSSIKGWPTLTCSSPPGPTERLTLGCQRMGDVLPRTALK